MLENFQQYLIKLSRRFGVWGLELWLWVRVRVRVMVRVMVRVSVRVRVRFGVWGLGFGVCGR